MLEYVNIKSNINERYYINENAIKFVKITNPTDITYLVIITFVDDSSIAIECSNMTDFAKVCQELGIEE